MNDSRYINVYAICRSYSNITDQTEVKYGSIAVGHTYQENTYINKTLFPYTYAGISPTAAPLHE